MKESNTPLISIVIINYNWKKYLERTIALFLNLSYKNTEIIVVDNGSSDGSIEFLEQYDFAQTIKSPRFREKNFACNLWIQSAKWEYIFLCDNDLLLTNFDLLQELLEMYNQINNIWILWISYKDEWTTQTNGYWVLFWNFFIKSRPIIGEKDIKKYHWGMIWFPHGIWFFIKKDIWNTLWWYDDYLPFWWDDNDLWIRSWLFWYKNYIYANSLQIHIWLQERVDTKKFVHKFTYQIYAELYVIVKNYTFFNMIKTLFLYSIYLLLKSIKQSFEKKSLYPFFAFFQGYYLFLKNISVAINKRKDIQNRRKIREDIFLNIN